MKRYDGEMRHHLANLGRMALLLLAWGLTACGSARTPKIEEVRKAVAPVRQRLVVSVEDQMMVTFERDQPRRMFPVSTSRFGTGDKPRTFKTPLGRLEIVEIIGQGLPPGAKMKARMPTGEIVPMDAPGRDPIVTRVLRLRGMEKRNAQTMKRLIYIHGTPEESKLKTPASWGCVRMGSENIITLCKWVKVGARVDIVPGKLPSPDQLPP